MTTDELKVLGKVAKAEARRHFSKSGGHEVDDVAQVAIIEYLARVAKTEIKNPGAMIRMIAKRCAWKYRTKWKKRRDDFVLHHLSEADEVARADTANLGPGVPTPEDVLISRKEVELVEFSDSIAFVV